MDNASKALIMAGAILIAVALVGVGVYLYQSATGTMNSGVAEMNATEMATVNSTLESYRGTISGTQAKSLIRYVETLNKQKVFPQSVTLDSKGVTTTSAVAENANYTVTLDYGKSTDGIMYGYVKNVKIVKITK